MPRFLHLVKADSAALATSVIEAHCRQPGAEVTVVLLDGDSPLTLPARAQVRRLGDHDLPYSALVDLIFESDHVMAW
jgi:hypothetical protein